MKLMFMMIILILLVNAFANDANVIRNNIKIITAKELHDKYLGNDSYVLIDNRPKYKYEMAHISGAINLTYFKSGSSENVLNKPILLNTIKDKSVIFYCTGYNRAYHAAIDATQKWNVPNDKVFWFKGGMIEWQKNGYSVKSKRKNK